MILRQNSLKDICFNAHTVYWIFIESTIRCSGLYHVLHHLLSSEFTRMCRTVVPYSRLSLFVTRVITLWIVFSNSFLCYSWHFRIVFFPFLSSSRDNENFRETSEWYRNICITSSVYIRVFNTRPWYRGAPIKILLPDAPCVFQDRISTGGKETGTTRRSKCRAATRCQPRGRSHVHRIGKWRVRGFESISAESHCRNFELAHGQDA